MRSGIKGKRIGIFGGTFDPPHIAHLRLAEEAREKLQLSKIFFVPAYIPPGKKPFASAKDRLNMVKIAVRGNKFFVVSDIEIRRKGISYTIDTVKEFRKRYDNLFLLIGEDEAMNFHNWKDWKEILNLCNVAYFRRGFNIKNRDFIEIETSFLPISSTEIRRLIKRGMSIRYLVPDGVERYIRRRGLYK